MASATGRLVSKGLVDLFVGIGVKMTEDRTMQNGAMPRMPLWLGLGLLTGGVAGKVVQHYTRADWLDVVADPLMETGTFMLGEEAGAFIDAKAFGMTDPGIGPRQFQPQPQYDYAALAQAQQQAALQAAATPAQPATPAIPALTASPSVDVTPYVDF